jgi:mannitol PTS system EIIA component
MTTPSKADPDRALLTRDLIRLGIAVADRDDAIRSAGRLLVDAGAVAPPYVEAMLEREAAMSSYMGEDAAQRLRTTDDVEEVLALLLPAGDEEEAT